MAAQALRQIGIGLGQINQQVEQLRRVLELAAPAAAVLGAQLVDLVGDELGLVVGRVTGEADD